MNPQLKQIEDEISRKVKEFAPENYTAFQKAVIAGDKIMFDPKTHQHMELVRNPESRKTPVETVAKGVTGLMWVMYRQSRQTMDLQVMIAAGTVLLMHAIDFAERGMRIQFDAQMIGDAAKTLAYLLMKKLGISPEQLNEAIQKGADEIQQHQAGGKGGQEQPVAPNNQGEEQPPPSGMLAQAGGQP